MADESILNAQIGEEKQTPTLPDIPLTIPGLGNSPYQKIPFEDVIPEHIYENLEKNGPTFISGGEPVLNAIKNPTPKAGWFEQAGHIIWKMNHFAQAGEFIYDSLTKNPGTDIAPDNWTAMTPEAVEGFPEEYFHYLVTSETPNDLEARQQHVREQMVSDERFSNGSITAELFGGFVGFASDPFTWLLPMASGLKYASFSQNLMLNIAKVAPNMALDSVSRNMLIQANRAGGNLQDMATDSLRDFVFGTALVGAGATLSHGFESAKLWNMRKTMNFTASGVDINPIVNESGVIQGYKGSATPGGDASAAVVDAANLYITESMHMGGLFALPYVGQPIQKLLAWGPMASPALKAATSPYQTVKTWYNRIAPNGIITTGEQQGIAREDSAHDFASFYNSQARSLSNHIKQKFYEANGITGDVNTRSALKNLRQTITKNQTITLEKFGQEMRRIAYEEGYKSEWSQAHEATDSVLKFFEQIGKDYHESVGIEGEFLDPRTAFKYLPQNYNIQALINEPEKFIGITVDALRRQDNLIAELKSPITKAESHLELLQSQKKSIKNPEELKRIKNEIKSIKTQISRHENELVTKLRTNKEYHLLLEDRVLFDEAEREQFNTILKPLYEANSQKVIIEARLNPYLKEKKQNPKNSKNNEKIKEIKEELERAEQEIIKQKELLERNALEGEIDKKFFRKENGQVHFYEPNKKPSFRESFKDDAARNAYAEQVYHSILNQSPNDLLNNVLGHVQPGIIENPSYLKQRTVPIDSQWYNQHGFLDPDISKSVSSYANSMGKVIGFKKAFPEFSESSGMQGILLAFQREHNKKFAEITAKDISPQRTKELQKLNKERIKAEKLMKDTYSVFMGTYNPGLKGDAQAWLTSIKNLVYSSKLGAIPLYQIAELGNIVMKHGLMPFLAQGLRPMIKTLNGTLKGKESEEMRSNAAGAYLAINQYRNGLAQKLQNPETMSTPLMSSIPQKVSVATGNLAHMSGNFFGTNALANANETMVANIFQHEVMKASFDLEKGTITLAQKRKMARYGIQIENDGPKFTKAYRESGGWEQNGGFYSNYYQWVDTESANRMALSMRRAVHDTVVNGNLMTSPYWTNNPIIGTLFMFHGWAYGALTHFAIPVMQRPDAEHLIGTMMVVSLSMMTEPLKRLANGKTAYDDDTTWFDEAYKAVDYSGILGPYPQFLQDINNMLGGSLVPHLQNEKNKQRPHGIVGGGGPVAGYLDDVISSVWHTYKGDLTESDVKRMYRLAPFLSHLAIREPANKYIESFNLPKTRRGAHSWSWRELIYGPNK